VKLVDELSVETVHCTVSTAVVIAIYNWRSRLKRRSPTLTKFLLREQLVGLYMHQFICVDIQH